MSAPKDHNVAAKDKAPRWLKDVANVTTRRYALQTSSDRPAPDFLIIGTKRGGTTSLFNYLLMHPGVLGLFPQNRGKKSTDFFFADNLHRGERWYRSHFHAERYRQRRAQELGYRPLGGEASPFYIWDPRIARRVAEVAPNVKAIMLMRDPVERAWSHYLERRQNHVEPLSFERALESEEARLSGELDRMLAEPDYHSTAWDWYSYRSRGDYLPQLENWRSAFDRDNLLVLRSEDMYGDVQAVFDQVCTFLGIPAHELPTRRSFNAAVGSGTGMPAEAEADLKAHFAPKVAALETALGRKLDWSV